jgi:hypothetical protein
MENTFLALTGLLSRSNHWEPDIQSSGARLTEASIVSVLQPSLKISFNFLSVKIDCRTDTPLSLQFEIKLQNSAHTYRLAVFHCRLKPGLLCRFNCVSLKPSGKPRMTLISVSKPYL